MKNHTKPVNLPSIEGRGHTLSVLSKNKKQLIIELDGRQHYDQVWNWKDPLEQQIRDKYKEFKAKKKEIPLIRCIQEDVWMDRNDWQIKLENLLQQYH